MITLRPYQSQTVEAVYAAESRGQRKQLVVLPTGTGKTVVFAELLRRRQGRALVLAHRDELLMQARNKIQAVWPAARVGIVRGEINQINAQVVVASIQTLGRESRLRYLRPDFQTVIIDEAHHVKAVSYERILEHLTPADPLLVGFTATGYRGDGKPICADDPHAQGDEPFKERVFEMDIATAIRDGWLCEIEGRLITLRGADFNQVHTKRGDLDTKELEALMNAANWTEHLFKAWDEHCRARQCVIFVPPRREMAWALEKYFNANGARVAAVTGDQDVATRRRLYQRFAAGELQCLLNVEVLTEGWDESSVDCVIMARPTKSKTVYVQAIGRGLRLHPGKANCLVLDVCGVTQRHDLMSMTALTGVMEAKPGEKFTEAKARAEREEKEREEQERERLAAEHESHKIDLLRRRQQDARWEAQKAAKRAHFERQAQGETMRWLNVDGGRRMSVRVGAVIYVFRLRQLPDGLWQSGLVIRKSNGASPSDWPGAIKRTAEEARAVSETKAREILDAAKPAWVKEPASEKQMLALRKFRVPFGPGLTKGEAGKLLDQCFERAKARKVVRA